MGKGLEPALHTEDDQMANMKVLRGRRMQGPWSEDHEQRTMKIGSEKAWGAGRGTRRPALPGGGAQTEMRRLFSFFTLFCTFQHFTLSVYSCEDEKAMGEHFRGNNKHGRIDAEGRVFLKINSIWVSS